MPTDTFKRELRQAARSMARSPGFTLIVIITLALGIGATTAIFTMLDTIVLRPLPYPDANQLVWLDSPTPGVSPTSRWNLSVAEFFYFKKNAHTLQNIGTYNRDLATVTGNVSAERVPSADVSASIFDVLGLRARLGRLLTPADNLPNSAHVAVLGYSYWQQRFNADPHVVGSVITVQAIPVQVVGVLQPGGNLPDADGRVDLWMPDVLDPSAPAQNHHTYKAIARVKRGVSVPAARSELVALTNKLPEVFPSVYTGSFMKHSGFTTAVIALRDHVIGDLATRLWILLGSVAVVLTIACANVANLFLVRAEARRREVAIRSALGAKRVQLGRQALIEGLLVGTVAAAVSMLLAFVGLRLVVSFAPPSLPRLAEIHLGWAGALFAVLLAAIAGLVFGSVALSSLTSSEDVVLLREGGRGTTLSRRQHAVRGALVIAQTGLALVLLAAAGLMLQSLHKLREVQPGFDPADVVTAQISLPRAQYDNAERVELFYRELLARARQVPGVAAAGAADAIPLTDSFDPGACSSIWVEQPAARKGETSACVPNVIAAPGYFRALGVTIRGRTPDWKDADSRGGNSVVVTKALADRFWPGEDAIGKGIKGPGSSKPPYYHVVGVTGELRGPALDQPPVQAVFFPMLPMTGTHLDGGPPVDMVIVLRSRGVSPAALTGSLRRIVRDLDPNVPLGNVRTMEHVVAQSTVRLSFTMLLLSMAAIMALVLSAVGIYGVISYIVSRRTSEIGIRMALGARASRVGTLVVMQSMRLAAIGVVLGIVGALAVTRVLRSVLFDVSPTDPVTLAGVSVLMLALAAAASYLPAQRAMSVDPVEALRAD